MNQKQREYAVSRVNGIEREKLNLLRRETTTPEVALSEENKVDLIRRGKVKLNPDKLSEYSSHHVFNAFDFSAHEKGAVFDEKSFNKGAALINSEGQRVKDEIMLGDAETAKKLVQEFAAA